MPLWYGIIVFTRVVQDLYRKGMKPYLVLSQVIKDVAFSCFISYEAQDWTQLRQYVEMGKKLTTAFMLISYPDIMITNNYETIKKNRYLYALFKSHPYTAELLRQYELRNGYLESPEDIKEYYSNIAGENPFLKIWNTILDIAENIPDMFRKWGEVITSLFYTKREDPFAFATHIISEYAKKAESVKLYNTPADVVEYYTSYAPYLIPSLIAYATIFGVYEDILNSMSVFKCDKGLFLKFPAPYFYQGKLLALGRPQADNTIIWTIKYEDIMKYFPRKYRDKWINGIIIEDDLGNSRVIQCNEILDFIPLFQNLHYTNYYYDETFKTLFINIEIKKILERMGINLPTGDPTKGVVVCAENECLYYDPTAWIEVLRIITKDKTDKAYKEPGTDLYLFGLSEHPKGFVGKPYMRFGTWELGETDLRKLPFLFNYKDIILWHHFASPLDPSKYANQRCYTRRDYIIYETVENGEWVQHIVEYAVIGVEFKDKTLEYQAIPIQVEIWLHPYPDVIDILMHAQIPAIVFEPAIKIEITDRPNARFFIHTFDSSSRNSVYIYHIETGYGFVEEDIFTWGPWKYGELGANYEVMKEIYDLIMNNLGWEYYPQQEQQ